MVVCPVVNKVGNVICCYSCKIADCYSLTTHIQFFNGKICNIIKFVWNISIGKPAVLNSNCVDHVVSTSVDIHVCTNSGCIKRAVFDNNGFITRICSCAVLNRDTTTTATEVAGINIIKGVIFHLMSIGIMSHTDTVSTIETPTQCIADIYIKRILCIPVKTITIVLIISRNRIGKSVTWIVMTTCKVVIISHGQCAIDGQILRTCHIKTINPRLIVRCQTFDVI